jgi:hypothetical protein
MDTLQQPARPPQSMTDVKRSEKHLNLPNCGEARGVPSSPKLISPLSKAASQSADSRRQLCTFAPKNAPLTKCAHANGARRGVAPQLYFFGWLCQFAQFPQFPQWVENCKCGFTPPKR